MQDVFPYLIDFDMSVRENVSFLGTGLWSLQDETKDKYQASEVFSEASSEASNSAEYQASEVFSEASSEASNSAEYHDGASVNDSPNLSLSQPYSPSARQIVADLFGGDHVIVFDRKNHLFYKGVVTSTKRIKSGQEDRLTQFTLKCEWKKCLVQDETDWEKCDETDTFLIEGTQIEYQIQAEENFDVPIAWTIDIETKDVPNNRSIQKGNNSVNSGRSSNPKSKKAKKKKYKNPIPKGSYPFTTRQVNQRVLVEYRDVADYMAWYECSIQQVSRQKVLLIWGRVWRKKDIKGVMEWANPEEDEASESSWHYLWLYSQSKDSIPVLPGLRFVFSKSQDMTPPDTIVEDVNVSNISAKAAMATVSPHEQTPEYLSPQLADLNFFDEKGVSFGDAMTEDNHVLCDVSNEEETATTQMIVQSIWCELDSNHQPQVECEIHLKFANGTEMIKNAFAVEVNKTDFHSHQIDQRSIWISGIQFVYHRHLVRKHSIPQVHIRPPLSRTSPKSKVWLDSIDRRLFSCDQTLVRFQRQGHDTHSQQQFSVRLPLTEESLVPTLLERFIETVAIWSLYPNDRINFILHEPSFVSGGRGAQIPVSLFFIVRGHFRCSPGKREIIIRVEERGLSSTRSFSLNPLSTRLRTDTGRATTEIELIQQVVCHIQKRYVERVYTLPLRTINQPTRLWNSRMEQVLRCVRISSKQMDFNTMRMNAYVLSCRLLKKYVRLNNVVPRELF